VTLTSEQIIISSSLIPVKCDMHNWNSFSLSQCWLWKKFTWEKSVDIIVIRIGRVCNHSDNLNDWQHKRCKYVVTQRQDNKITVDIPWRVIGLNFKVWQHFWKCNDLWFTSSAIIPLQYKGINRCGVSHRVKSFQFHICEIDLTWQWNIWTERGHF